MADRFYFRQLLSGRDFAVGDPMATQMVNFAYLIGDRATGAAAVVDPAYAVDELLAIAEADGMAVTDAFASHYHADHIGGSMMGASVEGIVSLLEAAPSTRVHVQRAEVEWVTKTTGLGRGDLTAHDGGDIVAVGEVEVTLLHTPGHTPGSQCFLVEGRLVAGDTLFLDGCGRTDLPGSDPEAMFHSLQHLAELPDETDLFPGHRYSMPFFASLGSVKEANVVYRARTVEQWMTLFGG